MKNKHNSAIVQLALSCALMVCAIGCGQERAATIGPWSQRSQAIVQQRLAPPSVALSDISQSARSAKATNTAGGGASMIWPQELTTFGLTADTAEEAGSAQTQPVEERQSKRQVEYEGKWRKPLPGFGETLKRDLLELPGALWDDTKRVYTNPWNLVFLIGAGGASVALRPEVDDDIEDYYDRHHSFKEDWRDAFGAAGNPIVHFGMAGAWYLTGQLAQDAKTYDVGGRLFRALTINGISTVLLKTAACTESPNGEDWAWPSGHVSSSMVVATVMNDAYGPLVGVPLFGLTGLVAVERMDSGEHHFSDVVFGAALGWVVAETIMKDQPPEIAGGHIVPYVDPYGRNAGVAWVKTLGE